MWQHYWLDARNKLLRIFELLEIKFQLIADKQHHYGPSSSPIQDKTATIINLWTETENNNSTQKFHFKKPQRSNNTLYNNFVMFLIDFRYYWWLLSNFNRCYVHSYIIQRQKQFASNKNTNNSSKIV